MPQKKLTDPYDIGWRDGYEACKMENNLPSHKTVLNNKDLREVIDKSYKAGYEEAKKLSYNEAYAEAKKLFENSISGHISWYDSFYLDFDPEEFHSLIYEKMELDVGDEVMITISKINKQQNKRDE